MTIFFNKLKKNTFEPFSLFFEQNIFFKKYSCYTQFHISLQHHVTIWKKITIQFRENFYTERQTDGWKDEQIRFTENSCNPHDPKTPEQPP